MKGALRLAQSLSQQAIEQIGFFHGFSRRAGADSSAWQKRDSQGVFSSPKAPVGNATDRAMEQFSRNWHSAGELLDKTHASAAEVYRLRLTYCVFGATLGLA